MTAFFAEIPTPYALTFAGQGSAWRPALSTSLSFPPHAALLRKHYQAMRELLAPVAGELLTSAPGSLERLNALLDGNTQDLPLDRSASISVPGITLAQLAALADLDATQLDVHTTSPLLLGHSQGILGAEVARAWIARDDQRLTHVLALAVLIGAAAQSVSIRLGATNLGEATPMLSVRGLPASMITEAVEGSPVSLAVVNGPRSVVLSGRPGDLEACRRQLEAQVAASNRALEEHLTGGTPLEAIVEFLPVSAPFHSPLLEEAVSQVVSWARSLAAAGHGIDDTEAERVARAILVERDDWSAAISTA
ncbi:MAG: ACP S-malonyltransferase, partial [Actinomyces sp.]|nr:ACP S-malonyltransferase [Actinomyces sp.]